MRAWSRYTAMLFVTLSLGALAVACGEGGAVPRDELQAQIQTPALSLPPTTRPTIQLTPAPPTVAPPPPDPTAAAAASYRAWMEEARLLHPYAESLEHMWAVMLCESSGDATVVAWPYHGLFQYSAETWGGAWNPYREQPILDPRAQIFATARAWQDGHQSWWGCYGVAASGRRLWPLAVEGLQHGVEDRRRQQVGVGRRLVDAQGDGDAALGGVPEGRAEAAETADVAVDQGRGV